MSAVGVYTINASSTLATPDANTANNAKWSKLQETATAATPVPYFSKILLLETTPAGWVNKFLVICKIMVYQIMEFTITYIQLRLQLFLHLIY